MPGPNRNTPKELHLFALSFFEFSEKFQYESSSLCVVANKTIKIFFYRNPETTQKIALAPPLSPQEIGELHKFLSSTQQEQQDISTFIYLSNTSKSPDTATINPTAIETVVVDCLDSCITIHGDRRNPCADQLATEGGLKHTYAQLFATCPQYDVTPIPYGQKAGADTGSQIKAPIVAYTGEACVDISPEQRNLRQSRRDFLTTEELNLLETMYRDNQRPVSTDALFELNPPKRYFYSVGLLASRVSGFIQEQIVFDALLEIARIFLNPITGERIAVIAPRCAEIPNHGIENCDMKITTDEPSSFSQHMLANFEDMGFLVTDQDLRQLIALMFREPPKNVRPRPQSDSQGNAEYRSFLSAAAQGNSVPTTPKRDRHQPAARQRGRLSSPNTWSPRKCTTDDPAAIKSAQDYMVNSRERLTPEDYAAALSGFFLRRGYTRVNDLVEESGASSRTLKNEQDSSIEVRSARSLAAAQTALEQTLQSGNRHPQIYVLQENAEQNYPVAFLYFDGGKSRLFFPEVTIKQKCWQELGNLIIGGNPVEQIAVDIGHYGNEHLVYHFLVDTMLEEKSVISTNQRTFSSQEAVKADINFSQSCTHQRDNGADFLVYTLAVRPVPSKTPPSILFDTWTEATIMLYEQGWLLVARVQDPAYRDLAFIFQKPDSEQYVVLEHPTHPTTLAPATVKKAVHRTLETLELPLKNIRVFSFQDEPLENNGKVPQQSITVKRIGAFRPESATLRRKSQSDDTAKQTIFNALLSEINAHWVPATGSRKSAFKKSFWQQTQEHVTRHRGKYLPLLLLIAGAILAGLTWGLGAIPFLIGAGAVGATVLGAGAAIPLIPRDKRTAEGWTHHAKQLDQQETAFSNMKSTVTTNRVILVNGGAFSPDREPGSEIALPHTNQSPPNATMTTLLKPPILSQQQDKPLSLATTTAKISSTEEIVKSLDDSLQEGYKLTSATDKTPEGPPPGNIGGRKDAARVLFDEDHAELPEWDVDKVIGQAIVGRPASSLSFSSTDA